MDPHCCNQGSSFLHPISQSAPVWKPCGLYSPGSAIEALILWHSRSSAPGEQHPCPKEKNQSITETNQPRPVTEIVCEQALILKLQKFKVSLAVPKKHGSRLPPPSLPSLQLLCENGKHAVL